MTNSQCGAVEYIRRFLTGRTQYSDGRVHSSVSKFKVESLTYGKTISVFATIDVGEPGTILHSMSHEAWLFFVGTHGAVDVKMAPKSMRQFAGKRAYGMNVARDLIS